jgi:hypothetical protein
VFSDPNRKDIVLRLAAQSWYILTFWDSNMPKEKMVRSVFETSLKETYEIAQKNWLFDSDVMWIFGYFMFINQFDFLFLDDDIQRIEMMGNELINEAHNSDPENPLSEVLYLADNGKKSKYREAKNNLVESIREYFPSNSKIDKYFIGIFTHNY